MDLTIPEHCSGQARPSSQCDARLSPTHKRTLGGGQQLKPPGKIILNAMPYVSNQCEIGLAFYDGTIVPVTSQIGLLQWFEKI